MKKILAWTGGILALGIGAFLLFAPTIKGPALWHVIGFGPDAISNETLTGKLKAPKGLTVRIFADNLPYARVIRVTKTGDMIVSSTREGTLTLLYRDTDHDGVSDGRSTLLSGLDNPHGFVLKDGWLYVSEVTQIRRFPFDAISRQITGDPQMILTGLPAGGNHRTRTLDFGPDGRLYVSIGSSCNVCEEENPFRATIISMNALGKDVKIFATGLRNSVGFDWKKSGFGIGSLFATENSRDLLGDDTPHDELNIVREGLDYGWPYAYDNGVPDPDGGMDYKQKAADSIHPYHGFGAHRAPLGIRFLSDTQAPVGYHGAALVALHGSWNRSTLAGYKVVSLHFDDQGNISEKDFLTGFITDGDTVIGRPVDVVQDARGIIYISDDFAGKIYSVTWGDLIPEKQATEKAPKKAQDKTDASGQKMIRKHPLAGIPAKEVARAQQAGMLTFIANGCAQCHVKAAAPASSYKPLRALKNKYTVDRLAAFLKSPPSPMPPPDTDDAGRRDLAIYLLSIQEEK